MRIQQQSPWNKLNSQVGMSLTFCRIYFTSYVKDFPRQHRSLSTAVRNRSRQGLVRSSRSQTNPRYCRRWKETPAPTLRTSNAAVFGPLRGAGRLEGPHPPRMPRMPPRALFQRHLRTLMTPPPPPSWRARSHRPLGVGKEMAATPQHAQAQRQRDRATVETPVAIGAAMPQADG